MTVAATSVATHPRARAAAEATVAALGLGLLADLLFREASLGLNAPLWIGALIAAVAYTGRHREAAPSRTERVCLALSFAAAAALAWRASPALQALLFLASGAFVVLAVAGRTGMPWRRMGVAMFGGAMVAAGIAIALGLARAQGSEVVRSPLLRRWKSWAGTMIRVAVIAVPVLLVFTALFASADAVFEERVHWLTRFDLSAVVPHVFWLIAGTWFAGGVIWAAFDGWSLAVPEPTLPETRRLRWGEVAAILGPLAALFTAFVLVQLRYLFGGHDVVQQSIGLTYAEYARRGFFELVTAAVLLLPLLLLADWARRHERQADRVYRALAGLLVALLFVIVASALLRMSAYEQAYGLTEARLYAVAVLLGLAVVFALFARMLLLGSNEWFVAGSVGVVVVVLAVLTVLCPDGLIARRNLARIATHPFDAEHAASLGANAVPVLVPRLGTLPAEEACVIARALLDSWGAGSGDSWRSWNESRAAAAHVVAARAAELERTCGGRP